MFPTQAFRSSIRVLRRLAASLHGRPWSTALLTLALAASAWGAAGLATWFTLDVTFRLPGRDALRSIGDMAQSTTLFDAADRPVFSIFREQRIDVPLSRVSPHLRAAVLSIEDQRFYDHRGVDVVRVGAALLANLRSGRRSQGGSTITQQLARQSFLTRDKTFRRKLKEVLLAAQIEHSYTKDEILELYLNKVYFGDGFYGVEAAALGNFGRHASEVTVAQAALLAGLIQSPSAYAPSSNMARAVARRNLVLAAMLETGAIDRAAYDEARTTEVVLENRLQREEPFGSYFKELVRRDLVERFGWERVSEGGLRVYTTIDSVLQPRVEAMVEAALQRIESRRGYPHVPRAQVGPLREDQMPDYLQGAVMVVDVATGEVRALVGGRSFKESRFNRAVQARRQAGSAFKPFLYAAAIEQGMSPASVLTGLDDPVLTAEGEWMPEDEHSGAVAMTLRTALRTSSNRAAVQLLRTVGIKNAVGYIRQFDVGDVPPVPSMALGAGDVTLASMTAAFAAFANGGVLHKPVFIRRIEDQDGTVLARGDSSPRPVVSEVTAFLVANMMADVITSGTGWRARASGFLLPAAGKTGTTNEYRDAWFVGFTPHVAAGVWIGFDQPKSIIDNGYAGELAVPLWAEVMKAATEGDPPDWLARPEGVTTATVCRISGKLPAEGCSAVETFSDTGTILVRSMVSPEYFARGTTPTEVCDLHPVPAGVGQVASGLSLGSGTMVQENASALPPPPSAEPPPAPATTETAQAAPAAEGSRVEEPEKKRGFWSRLFRRGSEPKKADPKRSPDGPRPPGAPSPRR